MKFFRLLGPDEIECRIKQAKKKEVSVLLYKTARTDADILDEVVGPENWDNDFKLLNDVLYGGIGIKYPSSDNYVWKWDAGTESNTEAEKGRASDAFKRAGFKHGIGRELYSAPFIRIRAEKCKKLKESDWKKDSRGNPVWECKDNFSVSAIEYDEKERISRLVIVNDDGDAVFEWTKRTSALGSQGKSPDIKCDNCGGFITSVKKRDGEMWYPGDMAEYSKMRYGKCLCASCMKIEEKAMKDAERYASREDGVE